MIRRCVLAIHGDAWLLLDRPADDRSAHVRTHPPSIGSTTAYGY